MVGVSKEMGLGVQLGVRLGVELQVCDGWYGLGLETGLAKVGIWFAEQAVLLCHGNYAAGHKSIAK